MNLTDDERYWLGVAATSQTVVRALIDSKDGNRLGPLSALYERGLLEHAETEGENRVAYRITAKGLEVFDNLAPSASTAEPKA